MLASLGDVIQETGKGGLLYAFELGLHIANVRGEGELQSIVEMHFVGWVDALEFQVIAHPLAERGKGFLPDLRHEEKRRTDIEAVTLAHALVAASAGG